MILIHRDARDPAAIFSRHRGLARLRAEEVQRPPGALPLLPRGGLGARDVVAQEGGGAVGALEVAGPELLAGAGVKAVQPVVAAVIPERDHGPGGAGVDDGRIVEEAVDGTFEDARREVGAQIHGAEGPHGGRVHGGAWRWIPLRREGRTRRALLQRPVHQEPPRDEREHDERDDGGDLRAAVSPGRQVGDVARLGRRRCRFGRRRWPGLRLGGRVWRGHGRGRLGSGGGAIEGLGGRVWRGHGRGRLGSGGGAIEGAPALRALELDGRLLPPAFPDLPPPHGGEVTRDISVISTDSGGRRG